MKLLRKLSSKGLKVVWLSLNNVKISRGFRQGQKHLISYCKGVLKVCLLLKHLVSSELAKHNYHILFVSQHSYPDHREVDKVKFSLSILKTHSDLKGLKLLLKSLTLIQSKF